MQMPAQYAIHCTLRLKSLCNTCYFKAKNTLSAIGKYFGKRLNSGITQKFSTRPSDIRLAKATFAKKADPELGLLVLEPFDIRRHGITHAQVSKKIAASRIHDNELTAWLHHAGNVAEDILIFADGCRRVPKDNAAFFVQMVDRGHGENNVKIVLGAIKPLHCYRVNAGMGQMELFSHGSERLMAFAGVITAFSQRLQPYSMCAVRGGPQAQYAF